MLSIGATHLLLANINTAVESIVHVEEGDKIRKRISHGNVHRHTNANCFLDGSFKNHLSLSRVDDVSLGRRNARIVVGARTELG